MSRRPRRNQKSLSEMNRNLRSLQNPIEMEGSSIRGERQSASRISHNRKSLQNLIGKEVKINRGGPKSKSGIVLNVGNDFISISADNKVYHFTIKHIHSITEQIKEIPTQNKPLISGQSIEGNKSFMKLLQSMLNQKIQLDNEPDSVGILLYVDNDLIVVFNDNDGEVHYNLEHIRMIATAEDVDEEMVNDNSSEEHEKSASFYSAERTYSGPLTFKDLFQYFKHKWVSLNRKGPEAIEGILMKSEDDFLTIINNEEAFHIHPFHIKSLIGGPKGQFKKDKQADEKEESSDNKVSSKSESNKDYQSSSSQERYEESSSSQDCDCDESSSDHDYRRRNSRTYNFYD